MSPLFPLGHREFFFNVKIIRTMILVNLLSVTLDLVLCSPRQCKIVLVLIEVNVLYMYILHIDIQRDHDVMNTCE